MTVGELKKLLEHVPDNLEAVLIMHNGPEAVYWMVQGERDGILSAIASQLVKPVLKDPRAFHCWLSGARISLGLDGRHLELRLISRNRPLLVQDDDRPQLGQLQLFSGQPEPSPSGLPQLSAGEGIVQR